MIEKGILSATGLVLCPYRQTILVADRSREDALHTGQVRRLVSGRKEPNDNSLIDAFLRELGEEVPGLTLEKKRMFYLGSTFFMRNGVTVTQKCFGVVATEFPVAFNGNGEMVNFRFEEPGHLLSQLNRKNDYEAAMCEWIVRAQKTYFLRQ